MRILKLRMISKNIVILGEARKDLNVCRDRNADITMIFSDANADITMIRRDANADITMIRRDAKYCVSTAEVLRLAKEIRRLAQDDDYF